MKPEGAAITGLYHVLHLLGEDGRVTALADLARAEAGKRYPSDLRQPARSQLLADFHGRVRRRRHSTPRGFGRAEADDGDSTSNTSSRRAGAGERDGSIIAGT
jgi:hypothetical protein